VFSQSDTIIEKFSANVIGEKVYLTWTVKAGYTCNGIEVYRATDSLNFTWIGSQEGVCGNISFPVDYEFIDAKPTANKQNFYRLNLGGNGLSEVVSVWYYDLSDQKYLVTPSPISDLSYLRFKNDFGLTVKLSVYGLNGKVCYTTETNLDHFILSKDLLLPGEYLFQLISEDLESEPVKGKIIVVH
jgi:hypothetical protein